jgi:hypothetical protein
MTNPPIAPVDPDTYLFPDVVMDALQAAIGSGASAGYDIVILAGQSNMSGRGTPFSATTDPINSSIFQVSDQGATKGTIKPASEPLMMPDYPSGIGPGLQFARWYASRKLASNRKVLLVPVAYGGTPLSSNAVLAWRRGGVAGNLYANMLTQVQSALTAAGTGARIVAALWLQGETDGDNNTTGSQYQTDLDALFNGLRADLSLPTLPIIVGTMVPEYLSTGTRSQINTVHLDTPNRIALSDVALSAVGMNMGDGNHFNAAGQRYNGKAMYDAFERIGQGLAPYQVAAPVPPGQVVGVTASSIGASSVTLTWTATATATSYLIEYRLTGGSTWTTGPTVNADTGSVTGLTASTGYDFRVTASNSIGPGTPSTTLSVSTIAVTTVLGLPNAAQAYSLRKVGDTYSGSAVTVRRSSDNTTANIGFVSGALDTASLLSFAGSGDAFVTTWFDQSGAGRDLAQATVAAQPKIVAAGALITSGGKTAVTFDGTDDCLLRTGAVLFTSGAATACQVLTANSGATSRTWSEGITAGVAQYGLIQPDTAGTPAYPVLTGAFTAASVTPAPTLAVFNNTIHQVSAVDTGAAISQWVDAAADTSNGFAYTRPASPGFNNFTLGGITRSGSLAPKAMTFSELLLWPSALSDTNRQTIAANQKAFYGTP